VRNGARTGRTALPAPLGLAALLAVFAFSLLLGAIVVAALGRALAGSDPARTDIRLSYGLSSLVMLLVTLLALLPGGLREVLGALLPWPGWRPSVWGLAAGIGLKLLGDAVVLVESRLAPVAVNNPLLLHPGAFTGWAVPVLILGVVVAAPLAEELLFRGLLYGWLRRCLPVGWAAVLDGAVFGLAHRSWTLAVPLGLVGAGLCLLYERWRSLWPSVLAHAALNATSLLLALWVVGLR